MMQTNAQKTPASGDEDGLSALADGELDFDGSGWQIDPARLGRQLQDEAVVRQWREFALIGDALRGQYSDTTAFMARFRAALAEEPTVLAPLPAKRELKPPLLWLAAAATVAGIAWVVFQPSPDTAPDIPLASIDEADSTRVAAELSPYLLAHQDYAHAVLTAPEMNVTRVALSGVGR
jgi:sigma-E factor negative regulatory protein RseA